MDDDCDGEVDEDPAAATRRGADAGGGTEADAQIDPNADAGVTPDTLSAGDGATGGGEALINGEGCSVAGEAGGALLPSLLLLGLLLPIGRREVGGLRAVDQRRAVIAGGGEGEPEQLAPLVGLDEG